MQGAPLYLQIATRVKHQIAARALREGARLPSLREGAERWGVNLHTVRRAYEALEADGLVRTDARSGTRVTASSAATGLSTPEAELRTYVESVARTARARFGLSAEELARRIATGTTTVGPIWVLECSPSLARDLADQVAARTGLPVRPWVFRRAKRVPEGYYLATYYHFAEVGRLLADRRERLAFFGVRIARRHLARMVARARRAGRLVLLAVDAATGGAIAADLAEALPPEIPVDLRVTRSPHAVLDRLPTSVPVLLTPENWERLPALPERRDGLFPLRLEPDEDDLRGIAEAFGWTVARRPQPGRAGRRSGILPIPPTRPSR